MTTKIAMTNRTAGALTDAECKTILDAASVFLAQDFCPDWGLRVPELDFYPDAALVPNDAWEIAMVDNPPAGDEGLEAYHDDKGGVPDGFCFAGFLLKNGFGKFVGSGAISQAWGHELAEALRNPRCNLILQGPWSDPKGTPHLARWAEVCDAAQGGHLSYVVDGTEVWMPAYALPDHEDLMGKGPFSKPAGLLLYPGHVPADGYGGYVDGDGKVSTVFGDHVHPAIVELKSARGRVANMAAAHTRARMAQGFASDAVKA